MKDGVGSTQKKADGNVQRQSEALIENSYVIDILDSLPYLSMVVNNKGLVLFANKQFRSHLGQEERSSVLGRRPGELLQCVNTEGGSRECGSTSSCKFCGIMNTITNSRLLDSSMMEEASFVSLKNGEEEQFDFVVSSSPLMINGEILYIIHFRDITLKTRKRAMERVFFHDVMNTAHGLLGSIELLETMAENEKNKMIAGNACKIAKSMVEEIAFQKDIVSAETGDLFLDPVQIISTDVLQEVIRSLENHNSASGKTMKIDETASTFTFVSDNRILRRILINMVKNGLEASTKGDVVVLNCKLQDGHPLFAVRNKGVMTEEVKARLWHRSFSTKGEGRGLGTYSMKLFTEQYLDGKIEFISKENMGTKFILTL